MSAPVPQAALDAAERAHLDIPNTKPHTREDWIGATGAPDWLRARADRIEAQP